MNEITTMNQKNEICRPELSDMLQSFIRYTGGSERTRKAYLQNLKKFFDYIAAKGVRDVTQEVIEIYRDELAENHKHTTVNAYLIPVKLFFEWADMHGYYKNVAAGVKCLKVRKGFKKDVFQAEQIADILQQIDTTLLTGKRDYAMISLMVTCGLRTIEVQRANVKDYRRYLGRQVLFIQQKGHDDKDKPVMIEKPVAKAIQDYLKARGQVDPEAPLFTGTRGIKAGERMTTNNISALVKKHFRAAGYDSEMLTAHSLRHTAATLILKNGGTVEEAQDLLGHENINTTMIYVHIVDRMRSQSESRISAAIFG